MILLRRQWLLRVLFVFAVLLRIREPHCPIRWSADGTVFPKAPQRSSKLTPLGGCAARLSPVQSTTFLPAEDVAGRKRGL